MSFLPADYTSPKSSSENYMKLVEGENKIRILTAPALGWEDWIDNKPVRFRMNNKPIKPNDPKKPVRHFWSFVCWNYNEEKIQILNITQATIRNCIEALSKDEDWGEPYFFDIKIIKKGEGVDTEYMVNPLPHKAINPAVKLAFEQKPCQLEALFDNADPFAMGWDEYSRGVFSKDELPKVVPIKQPKLSKEDVDELDDIISKCNPMYRESVMERLKHKSINATSLYDITPEVYAKIKEEALQKRADHVKFTKEEEDIGF